MDDGAVFNMTGGIIGGDTVAEGNSAVSYGGGVYVIGGIFNMYDSTSVSGNRAENSGGGVIVQGDSTLDGILYGKFTMWDQATIYNNEAEYGGGVAVWYYGIFKMRGTFDLTNKVASVHGNKVTEICGCDIGGVGGGVDVFGGTLYISDGIIYGDSEADPEMDNTAETYGAALTIADFTDGGIEGKAQRGTFNSSGTFEFNDDLIDSEQTISIRDGVFWP